MLFDNTVLFIERYFKFNYNGIKERKAKKALMGKKTLSFKEKECGHERL